MQRARGNEAEYLQMHILYMLYYVCVFDSKEEKEKKKKRNWFQLVGSEIVVWILEIAFATLLFFISLFLVVYWEEWQISPLFRRVPVNNKRHRVPISRVTLSEWGKKERETKHERNIRERERKRELPCFVCWERIKVAKKVSSLSAGPYPSRWIVRMKKETRRRTFRLGV